MIALLALQENKEAQASMLVVCYHGLVNTSGKRENLCVLPLLISVYVSFIMNPPFLCSC